MKFITTIYSLFLIFFFIGCHSQTKTKGSASKGNPEKIYISGVIQDGKTKESIPFATFSVFSTDTGSVWQGSVRRGMSDNLGNYKVDITTLVDSTNTIVIRSKYIRNALTHIIIKGKIKKSIIMNIDEMEGSGDYYKYFKMEEAASVPILEKEINKVHG